MNDTLRSLCLGALIALGTTAAPAADEKTSTWEDTKAWTHEKKADAVAAGKKMLAASDKKIAEMQAQAKTAGQDAQAAHRQNMQELKAQRKAAAVKLRQLEKAGATAWDGTRDAFASAYKNLTDSQAKAAEPK